MKKPAKLVILELEGDCRTEAVRVKLEAGPETARPTVNVKATLPPNPELMDALEQWRNSYHRLGQRNRIIRPQAILYDGHLYVDKCRRASQRLEERFKDWLASASFRTIDERVREAVTQEEVARVLIETQYRELQWLPWHLWGFIDAYRHTEVGLSSTLSGKVLVHPPVSSQRKVKILAILGHSEGIDTKVDQRLLQAIPGAEVQFLNQPARSRVSEQLWDQRWDILFFAGHSETEAAKGYIYLNPEDKLSLEDLKYSLRRAIANGLQLAIFNSCDGLGLAYELEALKIPQMIVMREPVPDLVAHTFLKGFLQAFSRGDSLYVAVREARERLEGMQGSFPCASWLPVIYQNSASPVLQWTWKNRNQWIWQKNGETSQRKIVNFYSLFIPYIVASIVIACRILGFLEGLELKAYDHLISIRPPANTPEERILTILVTEEDIQFQKDRNMELQGSLSDEALLQLLKKIEPYDPRVIGLDIIHDFPFEAELDKYLKIHNNIYHICHIGLSQSQLPEIAPPNDFPIDRVGFINFPLDSDNVIRRQLFGMSPGDVCSTDKSLSFQMAWEYLDKEHVSGIMTELEEDESLTIKSALFRANYKKFQHNSGGYNLPPKEAQGYQILVNYRTDNILSYSLKEILSFDDFMLKYITADKMILIGVDSKNSDRHRTPLNVLPTATTPGVLIHAQMASDILSSALDRVPSVQWWPETWENVWIVLWSFVGFIISTVVQGKLLKRAMLLILFFFLYGLCLYLMVKSIWVPLVPCLISMSVTFLLSRRLFEKKIA